MDNILKAAGLSKKLGNFALEDVSFALPQGYVMGLIGANGAGKTTTIRLLLNLLRRDRGQVTAFGLDLDGNEEKIKQQVGTVFDRSNLVEDWTVSQAKRAVSQFYDEWDETAFQGYLSRFRIQTGKKVKDLSRGMTVKLSLAMALSHNAKLLILDEPTSGLDPVSRDELLDILREYILDGEHSVLFSTHITGDLEKVADYITYLRGGRVIFTGPREELTESFLVARGEESDLPVAARERIIGLRGYGSGYEGLVRASDAPLLGSGALREPASIEQIMIFMGKEGEES